MSGSSAWSKKAKSTPLAGQTPRLADVVHVQADARQRLGLTRTVKRCVGLGEQLAKPGNVTAAQRAAKSSGWL